MNRYDIKVYDKTWVYQQTINPNVVMNDINFSENVNWWQWQISLNLALSFWDTTFHWWEIIKVILYNERYKQGKQIYMWYVTQISRKYDANKWYISIVCLWIASLLNAILFSWSYSWTVEYVLNAIISEFNNNYSWNLITVWQIDSYSENISVSFDGNTTCAKAINTVNNIANYYWFIDSEWMFYFRQKWTQTNHIVANQQVVESMDLKYDIEQITNKIYVERKDWTVNVYQDTNSQNLFGIKEKYSKQQNIVDETTQAEYWNNYLDQYSTPKNASTIVINAEYDIESIVPWDTVTVVNSEYSIKNLLIEKIKYTPTKITLTLEESETLRSVISD